MDSIIYCPMCGLEEAAFAVRARARAEELRIGAMCPDCGEMLRGMSPPGPVTIPVRTTLWPPEGISAATAADAAAALGPHGGYWWIANDPDPHQRPEPLGLARRYAAGLASLLDRPDPNVRVRAVIPRTGVGGGFVVVCRLGDDLRQYTPAECCPDCGGPLEVQCPGSPALDWCHRCNRTAAVDRRLAEAELTFVLRRAATGSGRLVLNHPCRRDPAGGLPVPQSYGRLTVLGRKNQRERSRWFLRHADAERLVQRRVLPELAWTALEWWPTWIGADPA